MHTIVCGYNRRGDYIPYVKPHGDCDTAYLLGYRKPNHSVPAIRYNAVYGYHYGWPEIALYRIRKDGVNVLIQIWN